MKKCPNCQRTFEDSMRFCQSDGTPLVDDAPAVDPYKTMVASSGDISAAMGQGSSPADAEPAMKVDEEVLQLPENDPKKTMYASEEEIRREMQALDEPVIDLPGVSQQAPGFSDSSSHAPSFGDVSPASPPPSPFSPSLDEPIANPTQDSPFTKTTPPIPSPFDNPKPSTYEPAREFSPDAFGTSPIGDPIGSAAASSPVQSWEPAQPAAGGSFSPTPAPAGGGQNKTLAIISLVAGILGLTVCCGGVLPNVLAIVLGFMAKNKAASDPANYGGRGLAMGGIITGVIGLLGTIALWIFVIFFNGMALLMQGGR